MGLFPSNEEKIVKMFGELSAEQQEALKAKLFPTQETVGQPTEPAEEQPTEEPQTQTVEEPVTTDEPKEEPKGTKETFEEMFKRLTESIETKMTELEDKFNGKLEEMQKPKVEKKPFGLAENSKEYQALARPKGTSDDWIKKHFSK